MEGLMALALIGLVGVLLQENNYSVLFVLAGLLVLFGVVPLPLW